MTKHLLSQHLSLKSTIVIYSSSCPSLSLSPFPLDWNLHKGSTLVVLSCWIQAVTNSGWTNLLSSPLPLSFVHLRLDLTGPPTGVDLDLTRSDIKLNTKGSHFLHTYSAPAGFVIDGKSWMWRSERDYQLPCSDQLTLVFEITARTYLDCICSFGLELQMVRGLDVAFEMRRTKKSHAHRLARFSS